MNKKILSWALYDWANSVFFTTVMAGFFPVFFKKFWNTEATVSQSTERLGLILAISGFTLAFLSPFLGALSDQRSSKKKYLFFFMAIGCVANAGLFWVPQGDWLSAAVLYGIAFFSCSASCVFYDSLLVSVSTPANYDRVSSLGYSLGYLGGGLLFILNVLLFQKPEMFGLSSGVEGVRLSFLLVSAWWFVFTWPLMINVSEPQVVKSKANFFELFKTSQQELWHTLQSLKKQKTLFMFVVAYWFYIDGVSTVMSMAVDFGISIGFEAGDLIKALLVTQFVGFPAAYFTGYLGEKWGTQKTIAVCLVIYMLVVVAASVMSKPEHFYVMAFVIGLAQGGVQALSRSFYASIIPAEKSGEYFGFFNLLGKFASVLGPLLMAATSRVFGSPQKTILSLLLLFVLGLYFLIRVQRAGASESRELSSQ